MITGIALVMVAAAKVYPLIITLPDTMSLERRAMLKAYGDQVELTPGNQGIRGAIARAEAIVGEQKNAFILQQFGNPANPKIHRATTALDIWEDAGDRRRSQQIRDAIREQSRLTTKKI